MNRYIALIQVFVISICLAIMIPACTQLTQSPVEKVTIIKLAEKKPPEFRVTDLKVSKTIADVGSTISVSGSIYNAGGEGDYKAVLAINDQEKDSKTVKVGSNSSGTFSFPLTINKVGKYKIGVGDSTVALIVSDCSKKDEYTISYDVGTANTGLGGGMVWSGISNTGQTTRFTPTAVPFAIKQIKVCGVAVVEYLTELDTRTFTLTIYDNSRNKIWSKDYPWRVFNGGVGWREFEIPNITLSEDFYVEFVSHSELPQERFWTNVPIYTYIGIIYDRPFPKDYSLIPETRSEWTINGKTTSMERSYQGVNWSIRVIGEGCLSDIKSE
jgi:hypothetical protein